MIIHSLSKSAFSSVNTTITNQTSNQIITAPIGASEGDPAKCFEQRVIFACLAVVILACYFFTCLKNNNIQDALTFEREKNGTLDIENINLRKRIQDVCRDNRELELKNKLLSDRLAVLNTAYSGNTPEQSQSPDDSCAGVGLPLSINVPPPIPVAIGKNRLKRK